MLDDDGDFQGRKIGEKIQYIKEEATRERIEAVFLALERKLLSSHPHGGVGTRLMAPSVIKRLMSRTPEDIDWEINYRAVYCLAFNTGIAQRELELGRLQTREDFDYTLQLLRKGHQNAIAMDIVFNERGYGAKGGATDERSVQSSNEDAEKLAALHPGLVKVVDKPYVNSMPRKEVIVSWKKALNHDKR